MTAKIWASVRGYVESPSLLLIDLEKRKIDRTMTIQLSQVSNIPISKRGFSGLQVFENKLVVANWDSVCFINPENGGLCNKITHPHFSDLHGLFVEHSGDVWVANTNLDSIYHISQQGEVHAFWSAWACSELGNEFVWEEKDYRYLTKKEIPYHRFHINSVFVNSENVFISFLGTPPKVNRFRQILQNLGIVSKYYRKGGIFVVDRNSRCLKHILSFEGLHDPGLDAHGNLYYTEYFGNALIRINPNNLNVQRIQLEVPSTKMWPYLARGVLLTEQFYWVGHTQKNGWHKEQKIALLRAYAHDGSWTGLEISLPGHIGLYELVLAPN